MRGDLRRDRDTGREPRRGSARGAPPEFSSEQLLRFLMPRRWFGAKGRNPQSARIVDAIPVPDAGWIVRVDVALADGVERYQLTLRAQESGVIGQGTELGEGLEDPEFRHALASAVARGTGFGGNGVRWVVDWTGRPPNELPEPRLTGAEQSNTSLIFGDQAILKIYRRLERGEHPDAEMARFLTTRAHFPHTPELLATARFESSAGPEVAAILQRFLPGSRDAWSVALERGREAFEVEATARIPFAAEAEVLGDITRAMHLALASDQGDPAFAPEPATTADVRRWASATHTTSDRALPLLERSLTGRSLPGDIADAAEEVLGQRREVHAKVDAWVAEIGDDVGERIRHHGDYHLGQVLHTPDGAFRIIDFEGEPARPLDERRAKHSALRDVAGMLRSFSYAAATCANDARAKLGERDALARAERWERELREAFLRGYLPEGREHPRFLPQAYARLDILLELFEMEKVFYELAYELNNRPGWAWIPLRGVVRMLRAAR
jgi:maltose alpha-D-glucosyltransferase/alpha-amylase